MTEKNNIDDVDIDITGEIESPLSLEHNEKRSLIMQLPVQLQMASPAAKEWLQKRRDNIRPWSVFISTNKFKAPVSAQRWTKRVAKNVDYFQSNYVFVFIVLIIYCLITSPLLLIALAAALGGCHIISLKNAEKKLVISGHEVPLIHQYAVMGIISLPVFYMAGAGAVLFWVLGASFFIIMVHASLYNIESVLGSEDEPFELQMEQV